MHEREQDRDVLKFHENNQRNGKIPSTVLTAKTLWWLWSKVYWWDNESASPQKDILAKQSASHKKVRRLNKKVHVS